MKKCTHRVVLHKRCEKALVGQSVACVWFIPDYCPLCGADLREGIIRTELEKKYKDYVVNIVGKATEHRKAYIETISRISHFCFPRVDEISLLQRK